MQGPPMHADPAPDSWEPVSPKGQRNIVQLDKNENPFDVPRVIKDEVFRRIAHDSWSRFREENIVRLRKKLATFNEWDPEGILVGNGSSELMQLLLGQIIDSTTRLLIAEPTLGPFPEMAEKLGADLMGVPLTDTLQFNVPKLCSRAVAMKADMVFLSSPHNPTGCIIAESDLVMLLKTFSGLVVLDEAYYEFARQTFVPLLKQYSHLVILRTFSIAMGMAGLRVGYMMAAPQLIERLRPALLPYRLNLFSTTAAEVAIDHYEQFRALIEKIVSERERLYRELRRLKGFDPVPSHANFMIVRTELPGHRLCQLLEAGEIMVCDLSAHPMLVNSVRVSVGTPAENDRLLAALRDLHTE